MRTSWGILGTGSIANTFVRDLLHAGHRVLAVASRSQASSTRFATRHSLARAYGSYEELVADPDITAVYVATPNPFHPDHALMAIEAGKHVLVEKPFALDPEAGRLMIEKARSAGLIAMEAMWTRFLPNWLSIKKLISDGTIGTVTSIITDISIPLSKDPRHRVNNPALGGGALMDLGVYGVSLAVELLGQPTTVKAVSRLTETQVDAQTSIILGFKGGQQALIHSSIDLPGPQTTSIIGSDGRIDVAESWFKPSDFTVTTPEYKLFEPHRQEPTYGLQYEAAEIERLAREGLLESPTMPHEQTIQVLTIMDAVLQQTGIRYPNHVERRSRLFETPPEAALSEDNLNDDALQPRPS